MFDVTVFYSVTSVVLFLEFLNVKISFFFPGNLETSSLLGSCASNDTRLLSKHMLRKGVARSSFVVHRASIHSLEKQSQFPTPLLRRTSRTRMPIPSTMLSLLLSLGLWALVTADCTVDPTVDYFPDKVAPKYSQNWSVEYHNTYKIVRNKVVNSTYLLYHCEMPQEVQADQFTEAMQVPLTGVAITETPMITFMEQLGLLDQVKYFATDPGRVSSPCFKQKIEAGQVVIFNQDQAASAPTINTAVIDGQWGSSSGFQHVIQIAETSEKTNNAIFEWTKFLSTFFNAEKQANQVTTAAANRLECTRTRASGAATDAAPPKVLWATYFDYCEGWSVGNCPNYYCEYAEMCGADFIETSIVGELGDGYCLSTEQLVQVGKDADYLFVLFPDWTETYARYGSTLDQLKAVQNKKVFDYQGSGSNAWFEERFAEFYDVTKDFCHVVGTSEALNRPTWFRNVFSEQPGAPGTCGEESSLLPVVDIPCNGVGGTETTAGTTTSSTALKSNVVSWMMSLLVAVVTLV